ncbi:unnamed protein product [Lactuca saligna]|uniref:Uncharacterized protein n=1 Tax=Lactuca saligna TaxID=75948 RepID=A0AA35YDA4_LACSI|nr:unnamed protein product [Lactuca saligna]
MQEHWCIHTRHSGRSSPLAFDLENERTSRSNRVARRNLNNTSVDNVVVEDVVEGHEDAVNNSPPLVPPIAPQFPNKNNENNRNDNHADAPVIQPIQPQLNRNNRGQNSGNGGNWAQNMGGNEGNHNGGNDRNQNQHPRNVGPQFDNGGNDGDLDFDDGSDNGIGWNQNHNGGNRQNQGNRGGNGNYNNNWNNQNFQNGGSNDYNDGFRNQGFGNQYRRNPNGGFNNANGGYYNKEQQPRRELQQQWTLEQQSRELPKSKSSKTVQAVQLYPRWNIKEEEIYSNKLDKIMKFITQTYQKVDTNSKSIAAIEK